MTITTGELIGIIFITAIVAFGIATAVFYNIFKCSHEWEEIVRMRTVDDAGDTTGIIVVHMCKKCGKRKITKV